MEAKNPLEVTTEATPNEAVQTDAQRVIEERIGDLEMNLYFPKKQVISNLNQLVVSCNQLVQSIQSAKTAEEMVRAIQGISVFDVIEIDYNQKTTKSLNELNGKARELVNLRQLLKSISERQEKAEAKIEHE